MSTRVPLIGLAALLLWLSSGACRGRHNEQHLAAVDSMIRTTDSLARVIDGIDMASMLRMDSIWNIRKAAVQARMHDTLTKDEAIALGNFARAMEGSLGRVVHDRDGVVSSLQLQRKQLTDLRHDVEHGSIDEQQESTYMQQEQLYLTAIEDRVSVLAASAGTASRAFELTAAHVDSLAADTTTRK